MANEVWRQQARTNGQFGHKRTKVIDVTEQSDFNPSYNKFIQNRDRAEEIVEQERKRAGSITDYLRSNNIRKKPYRIFNDSQMYYRPSDNIYSGTSQSGDDGRSGLRDLQMLGNERVGIGAYFTAQLASRIVRNWFDFFTWEMEIVKKTAIMKNLYHSNFFTQLKHLAKYELNFGTAFMFKYWKMNEDFSTPPPRNKPPVAWRAVSPLYFNPINLYDTNLMDFDEERWELQGGKFNTSRIHKDRFHVFCTRPDEDHWRGYSIFEPIYLSACAYMNLIVNGTKMVAKYGNLAVSFMMNQPNPSAKMYREFRDLVEEMKATYTFVLGKDEDIKFQDTKIGTGLNEFGDFLKEDMSAGTGLSLNATYGRSEGGGLSGAGALVAKEHDAETIDAFQMDYADDVSKMISPYWNIDDLFIKFRLDSQKTDEARLQEESVEWDNKIKQKQYESLALNNVMQAMQFQEVLKNPQGAEGGEGGGGNQLPDKSQGGNGKQDKGKTENPAVLSLQSIIKENHDFLIKNNEIYKNIFSNNQEKQGWKWILKNNKEGGA